MLMYLTNTQHVETLAHKVIMFCQLDITKSGINCIETLAHKVIMFCQLDITESGI